MQIKSGIKAKPGLKMPVSERAVFQRISRLLKKENKFLRSTKNTLANICKKYFVISLDTQKVLQEFSSLEDIAKHFKVLKGWEIIRA